LSGSSAVTSSENPASPDVQWASLIAANEKLAGSRSVEAVISILRETAREIVHSDGIAIILRDRDQCYYAAEDAIAPLWASRRFPVGSCISGWAMMNRQTVAISDIYLDPRVPHAAYRPTFVHSLVMVPIGNPEAIAAIGAYWSDVRTHDARTIAMLEALGRAAALSLENVRLEDQLRDMAATLEARVNERTEELSRAQDALRQSQRLEAMGQLTGGVAHDFNNLLAPIMGSLDLLKRRGVGGEREQRLIEGALQSSRRAKALVHRLLAFARRQPLTPAAVDIGTLLDEMSSLIGATMGPQITLVLEIAPGLPSAIADHNQIEMAVLNLAVNARDAMPDGGRLVLSASLDEVGTSHRAELRPGRYIRIAVADDGCGMSEETRRRAIEPFFSTKGVGKGTGLGLSMVHGLASQLGGGLALTSSLGAGTEVELWLPVSTERPPLAEEIPAPLPAAPGVVLLVDDEDLVRASTADMLSEMGFQVIESHSGEDALLRLSKTPHIDLLVTDHLMPSMTGPELARAVLTLRPKTAIVIISGYSEAADVPVDFPHLQKPFMHADLATTVARAFCA
jgi:signal transduction histidine kinase